jgi:hypothetical protein
MFFFSWTPAEPRWSGRNRVEKIKLQREEVVVEGGNRIDGKIFLL